MSGPDRRLLVTGGAGFIGTHFVRGYAARHPRHHITVLDALTYAGRRENLADLEASARISFVEGDIRDSALVGRLMPGIDAVVHFAAESHVDRSIMAADAFISTNVQGTWVLLEAARAAGVRRFIHVSTDEVYGSKPHGSSREDDPLRPSSPYAASKAAADLMVLAHHTTFGTPVLITRGSNNFGPYQHPEKLIPLFVTNALEDQPLPLYGDGLNARDWLYVEDHCAGIEAVLERGEIGTAYNLGGGNERTNLEVTQRILHHLGRPEHLVRFVQDRIGHDRRCSIDCSRAFGLGWKPRHGFEEALERTVRWYQEHEDWWRAIRGEARTFGQFYRDYYRDRLSG